MFLNERAQALAIVKVVCPKKLVKEFKNREIWERILLELKVGAGYPGVQRVIRFFREPMNLYSMLTLKRKSFHSIRWTELKKFSSVLILIIITYRKSFGKIFLFKRWPAIERQEPTLLGFPAIYSRRRVTSWTSRTWTPIFKINLKGAEGKNKYFIIKMCHLKIISI